MIECTEVGCQTDARPTDTNLSHSVLFPVQCMGGNAAKRAYARPHFAKPITLALPVHAQAEPDLAAGGCLGVVADVASDIQQQPKQCHRRQQQILSPSSVLRHTAPRVVQPEAEPDLYDEFGNWNDDEQPELALITCSCKEGPSPIKPVDNAVKASCSELSLHAIDPATSPPHATEPDGGSLRIQHQAKWQDPLSYAASPEQETNSRSDTDPSGDLDPAGVVTPSADCFVVAQVVESSPTPPEVGSLEQDRTQGVDQAGRDMSDFDVEPCRPHEVLEYAGGNVTSYTMQSDLDTHMHMQHGTHSTMQCSTMHKHAPQHDVYVNEGVNVITHNVNSLSHSDHNGGKSHTTTCERAAPVQGATGAGGLHGNIQQQISSGPSEGQGVMHKHDGLVALEITVQDLRNSASESFTIEHAPEPRSAHAEIGIEAQTFAEVYTNIMDQVDPYAITHDCSPKLCTKNFRVQTGSCNLLCENSKGHQKCLRSAQRYCEHISMREGHWPEFIEAISNDNHDHKACINMLSQLVLMETLLACPILQPQIGKPKLPRLDLAAATHALASFKNRRLVHAIIADISHRLTTLYSSALELQQPSSPSILFPSPPRRHKGKKR